MNETIEATDQAEVIEEVEQATVEIQEESAPSEEAKAEEQAQSEPEDKAEKEGGVQKRINELTKQRYEEARRAQEAEERAKAYEQRLAEVEQKNAQGQWQAQQPKIEDYDYDHDRWTQAYQSWHSQGVQIAQQAQQESQRQLHAQQEQLKKQSEVSRKVAEAQTKYPDFIEKLNSPDVPSLAQMNQTAYEAMVDSDSMGEIAYYLASNPAEVYRFQDMTPIRAVKEIAMLESRLNAAPAKITAAPAPPSKVAGQTTVTKDPDKLTTAEWMVMRRENMRN